MGWERGGGMMRGEYRKLFWLREGSSSDDWERMWLKKTNKQVKGRECEWLEWVRVKGVHVSGWVGLNDIFQPNMILLDWEIPNAPICCNKTKHQKKKNCTQVSLH